MAKLRGGSVTFDQPAPQPKDIMILAFAAPSNVFRPNTAIAPLGTISFTATPPGDIARGDVIQFPISGTIHTLRVTGDTPVTTTNEVFTIEKNGTATSLTATCSVGTTTGTDNTHTVTITAGDFIALIHEDNGSPTFSNIVGSMVFTPS